jgi:uncharacterized lipoprotein YddW (UPF0748 family)
MRRGKQIWVVAMLVAFTVLFFYNSTNHVLAATSGEREMRAVWMSTVFNIDWPSSKDYSNVEKQKATLAEDMKFIRNQNMNTVFFQVRTMGDALYPSSYAPWSRFLTGTLGKNPGYNPLKNAIEEAHINGLEFHAWFNPFRIDGGSSTFNKQDYINSLPANTALKNNPDWIVSYGKYHWLDVGVPEVREYVMNTILEVVKSYDVDGVHLDDYFYPYPVSGVDFPDSKSFELYGKGYSSVADWRRDNVNKFIKELNEKIKATKPYVKFGVSPFGIWKNGVSDGGSETNGLSSYNAIYVDSRKWVQEEWIDYIVPQIYWEFGHNTADYKTLVDWWSKQVEGKKVHLYIGHAAYKVGDSYGSSWLKSDEIANQINYGRLNKNVRGGGFFSLKDIKANRLGFFDKVKPLYSTRVAVPEMEWCKSIRKGWTMIRKSWYFLGDDGIVKTGWIEDNGKRYYLKSDGVMYTGWTKQDNWYYLGGDGAMKTGWVFSTGRWYYLGNDGTMKTGWIQVQNKWYYLYSDGHMAANTTISGYKIGKNGVWIQ